MHDDIADHLAVLAYQSVGPFCFLEVRVRTQHLDLLHVRAFDPVEVQLGALCTRLDQVAAQSAVHIGMAQAEHGAGMRELSGLRVDRVLLVIAGAADVAQFGILDGQ